MTDSLARAELVLPSCRAFSLGGDNVTRAYRTLQGYENVPKTINDCYNCLRIAVVQQTIKDYRRALRNLEELLAMSHPNEIMLDAAESRVEYFERWFVSDYGSMLCGNIGEDIMEFVRNEVRGYGRE